MPTLVTGRASDRSGAPAGRLARFCTKDGLCVYRLAQDVNTPHEVVAHWLVEQAVPGQPGMQMLRLKPLNPPGADAVDVPGAETVPLNDRFRTVWEAHRCDECSERNAEIRAAHIQAVRCQAAVAKQSNLALFHSLRFGTGNFSFGVAAPPELGA